MQPVSGSLCHKLKSSSLSLCKEFPLYFLAVDHCSPNMCANGASCQNQYDGYFCFCPPGYTGHRCEISGNISHLGLYAHANKINKRVLQLENGQKVRAIIGLVPTSQLPWWCYIENERTIWERNGLIETPTLRGNFAMWLHGKAWISWQLSNLKTPRQIFFPFQFRSCLFLGTSPVRRKTPRHESLFVCRL